MRKGKVVLVAIKLPEGGDHWFTIIVGDKGKARFDLHAWQNVYDL